MIEPKKLKNLQQDFDLLIVCFDIWKNSISRWENEVLASFFMIISTL